MRETNFTGKMSSKNNKKQELLFHFFPYMKFCCCFMFGLRKMAYLLAFILFSDIQDVFYLTKDTVGQKLKHNFVKLIQSIMLISA